MDDPDFNHENLDTIKDNFWTKVKGAFVDNKKCGKCTIWFANGGKLYCNFVDDPANGKGFYTTPKGKRIKGIWENN